MIVGVVAVATMTTIATATATRTRMSLPADGAVETMTTSGTRSLLAVRARVTMMRRTTVTAEAPEAIAETTMRKTGARRVTVTVTEDVTRMTSATPGIGIVTVAGPVVTTMTIEMPDGTIVIVDGPEPPAP